MEGHSGCGPPGGSRRCTWPRHLPVAGSTVVPTGTGEPAAVLVVGEGTALLRHLDGEVRQVPLPGLAPDPLDPANTHSGFVSQDAF